VLLPKVCLQTDERITPAYADLVLDIYNDEFFAGIDGVTNALDNVVASELSSGVFTVDCLTFL